MMLILGVLGLIIGTFSACAGEKVDRIITFICDVFISFPSLITAIAVISILGDGIQNIAVAVVISMWAWFARTVRSYAVTEMGKEYITSARISGCGTTGLIFRHLIPNILPQCIVYMKYRSCFCDHHDIELFISGTWASPGHCRINDYDG